MHPTPHTRPSYPGGKAGAGVSQRLINLMPAHTVYIEPFLGHGAVLLAKRPAPVNIGLDLDPQAVQVVRAALPPALARSVVCGSRPSCSDDAAGTSPVTSLLHRQSGTDCSAHGCDDDAGADLTIGPARYQVRVGDGVAFLRSYAFTGSELVYCDPPYVRSTRRTRARLYRHEMDDYQHTQLLAVLRRLPCAVMVSGYRSTLYAEVLHDWRTGEYQTQTRGGAG
jgi:hypothetical protein